MKTLEKDRENRYSSAAALGTILAGIIHTSTELVNPVSTPGNSLVTEYDKSLAAPPPAAKPRAAGPKTMLDDGAAPSRGASVFGAKSIPPSPLTRIQVVYKGQTAQVYPISSDTITVGRGATNNIPLTDPKASQRHAQVTWDGTEYYVMDLNSTNGTYLGSTPLVAGFSEVWRPNQNLRIGDTWLRLIRPTAGVQNASRMMSRAGASALFKSPGAGFVGVIITPQLLKIEPGGTVTGTLSLLNQSPNVDLFSLAMTGIPNSWIASLPSSVQLMPGNQTETVFSLHVPRATQSRAGQHQITLKVTSLSDPSQFVEARLVLTITAYADFSTELQPQRLRVGQIGRLTITNQGNSNASFSIKVQDPEEALDFRVMPRELSIAEGQSDVVEINASVRQPPLIGSDKIYPFTAEVTAANVAPQTQSGEVLGRAWLPRWALPVGLFTCMLLGLLGLTGYRNVIEVRQTQTANASSTAGSNLALTTTAGWLAQDDDRDGLTNEQEADLGTLSGDRDTDRDGLDDGQEVNVYKSDPLNTDSDKDGLKDGDEVSKGSDPLNTDSDRDGVPDNRDPDPASTPTATSVPTATSTPMPTNTPLTPPPPTPTPYFADFEGTVGSEWLPAKKTQSPRGRNFLGEFGNGEVHLILNNLPAHSSVTLNLDLYIIRSWDGNLLPPIGPDVWTMEVKDVRTLLNTTFCNIIPNATPPAPTPAPTYRCRQAYTDLFDSGTDHAPREGADEINTLGFEYHDPNLYEGTADAVYNLQYTFPHSGTSIELIFSASNLEVITDESWGLDNVELIFK
jgi:hypothetical protein